MAVEWIIVTNDDIYDTVAADHWELLEGNAIHFYCQAAPTKPKYTIAVYRIWSRFGRKVT